MWQCSALVGVSIKSCCCNISGTWFVGVILAIAGISKYGIVFFGHCLAL